MTEERKDGWAIKLNGVIALEEQPNQKFILDFMDKLQNFLQNDLKMDGFCGQVAVERLTPEEQDAVLEKFWQMYDEGQAMQAEKIAEETDGKVIEFDFERARREREQS